MDIQSVLCVRCSFMLTCKDSSPESLTESIWSERSVKQKPQFPLLSAAISLPRYPEPSPGRFFAIISMILRSNIRIPGSHA